MVSDSTSDPFRDLSEALLGQVLPGTDGRLYPLRERLGEGGQGWVFRATWNGSVDVVVKVLRPDTATGEALARFQREAQVLRTLSQQPFPNPHLVRFYDHAYATVDVAATGQSWDLPFTVLELVDGESLETAIEQAQPHGLGLERARRILRHTVLGLEDVHARNIVHRDLKPSNILLSRSTGREIAKVTDFGIAKVLGVDMQRTSALAGATVGYAPPEQFENGNPRVCPQTDVFSLAAIFYETVTGKPAFPIDSGAHIALAIVRMMTAPRPSLARDRDRLPRELADRPDVVAAVDAELSRALSAEPADRHPTATVLFEAIERALLALGSTPSIPPKRPSRGILVRSSRPPGDDPALDKTVSAQTRQSVPPIMAPATIRGPGSFPRDVAKATALAWRRVTDPIAPSEFRAISVSFAGGRAAALGTHGAALWMQGRWNALPLPPDMDPASARAFAWLDERIFVAGVGPHVVALERNGPPTRWYVDAPSATFHGVFADASGVLLAGARPTPAGPQGLVAEIRWNAPPRTTDIPGCGSLCGVVRFADGGVLACGEGGALAMVRHDGYPPQVIHPCAPSLRALIAAPDGSAAAVGDGGFVFRIASPLAAELEAIQTTRALLALARGPDGTLWCAGEAGRVLRRTGTGWTRVDADGVGMRVIALHATAQRVLVFCDDGSAFEGTAR